jgi:hypothetical protein
VGREGVVFFPFLGLKLFASTALAAAHTDRDPQIQQNQGAFCEKVQVATGSSNLARLFAGIKLQNAGSTADQSAAHNEAPISAAQVPHLLTPQLIQQQQAEAQDTGAKEGGKLLLSLRWTDQRQICTPPQETASGTISQSGWTLIPNWKSVHGSYFNVHVYNVPCRNRRANFIDESCLYAICAGFQ